MPRNASTLVAVAASAFSLIGVATLRAQPSEQAQPSPSPQEAATLLEAEPLPPPTMQPAPGVDAPSAPSPPVPPSPTPPLRTGDVAFPAPSARNESEPLVAIGRPVGRTDYGGEGNRKAAQLRSMPPERFAFDRALLRDVLRFLAEQAGMPFLSIPENSPQAQQLVTFRMTASPFAALESVARQNDIKLVYEDGVWFLRVAGENNLTALRELEDSNELVGVIYQLRHDPADRVEFRYDTTMAQDRSQQNKEDNQFNQSMLGTATTPNLPLQASQKVFVQKAPKIVNDIRAILGLKPLEYYEDGTIKDEDIVGGTEVPSQVLQALQPGGVGGGSAGSAAGSQKPAAGGQDINSQERAASGQAATELVRLLKEESRRALGVAPVYVPAARPQVVYNSDQNVIWVVATRQQHKWVAEYLSKVDKPQQLIAIEVKFLETKKNPQVDVGINWQNTFGTGLTVGGQASIGGTNIGSIDFISGRQRGDNTGDLSLIVDENGQPTFRNRQQLGEVQPGTTVDNNFGQSSVSGNIPYSAVLSLDQFSFTLQAFMQDRDTSIVQYPRVLTLNNKEVAITTADNTPLNVGTSTAVSATGTSGTTVGQLGYLPTGTQINILPKVVNANQIAMTVAITVSSVVGELPINLGTGVNLYPVTSERVYNASLQVDSGYTLAVGGLEKVDDSNVVGGIPVLQDIPGLGYLFKNKNKRRNKVNLIIFITPYLIGDPAKTPGISETPESIVPLRPGVPPNAPTFTPDGQLSGGSAAVESAFAWLDFQLQYFRQVNLESMMTLDSIRKLRDVIGVARALLSDLQLSSGEYPYDSDTVAGRNAIRAEQLLTDLNRALATAQENLM